jgi:hypothetical protein
MDCFPRPTLPLQRFVRYVIQVGSPEKNHTAGDEDHLSIESRDVILCIEAYPGREDAVKHPASDELQSTGGWQSRSRKGESHFPNQLPSGRSLKVGRSHVGSVVGVE